MQCVCAFCVVVFASLGKSGNFLGASLFPEEFVSSIEQLAIFFESTSVSIEDSNHLEKRIDSGVVGALDFVVYKCLELGR